MYYLGWLKVSTRVYKGRRNQKQQNQRRSCDEDVGTEREEWEYATVGTEMDEGVNLSECRQLQSQRHIFH